MKIISLLALSITLVGISASTADEAGLYDQEPIYIPPELYSQEQPRYNPNSPQDILIGPAGASEPSFNFNLDINVPPQPVHRPIQPNVYVEAQQEQYDPRRNRHVGAYGDRPLNPRAFNTWHVRGMDESIEWYLANIVGNVYASQHEGVISDINGDGYADKVFLVEINPGGYYDTRYQFVSVWINYGREYEVHNSYVNGLYSGVVVDAGQVYLVNERMGRRTFEPYVF